MFQPFSKSFKIPTALAPGHPYGLRANTIHFLEFRGIGPPSVDFGHAGDVYVDLTPGVHALYWRERDDMRGPGNGQWRRWMALLLDRLPIYRSLVAHPWARDPESSDLFLWVDPGGITWTSKDILCASRAQMIQRNIAIVGPGTVPDVEGLVSEILHRMLNAERPATHAPRGVVSTPYVQQIPSAGYYGGTRTHTLDHCMPSPNPYGARSSPALSSPSNMYSNRRNDPIEQERYQAAERALDEMRRAQDAESKSKQELKQKSRELAKLRQKEKDIIGMSYHYQKRERELVTAIAAAEHRSSTQLEEMRAEAHNLQRQAESARQQTQNVVARVRSSREVDSCSARN
ncbi:hypothetical protein C8R47DRAFT_569529 [Mycena vitilis]|nr:hypothetical protein C8R47DRAFT_569529 [Mycena vitilis]